MNHDVLVADANALGMIAVLRSLGRAGYKVHAVASDVRSLGFRSQYVYRHATHPPCDSPDFIPWLSDYVREFHIDAIVCSEEFLQAVGTCYAEFECLIPDRPANSVRELCLSKRQVFNLLNLSNTAKTHLPASGVLDSEEEIEKSQIHWKDDEVYYLKLDGGSGLCKNAKSRVVRVGRGATMPDVARRFLQQYSTILWQSQVSGLQVGVSLWRHKGDICAENMVLGLHLYPWYAGNMSLRKTWWHQAILDDAICKLNALNWCGVAMMEYIWNPETDEFWFIEMNPRYWGYLHLDLSCGKDFPRLQIDAHFGRKATALGPPSMSRIMRYAPGEILHIASWCLEKNVSLMQKVSRIGDLVLSGINPKVKADLWFNRDSALYFFGWVRFIRSLPRRLGREFGRRNRSGEESDQRTD